MADNIKRLSDAKVRLAMVYESEARDDVFDNGFLSIVNNGIMNIEQAIKILKARKP